MSREPDAAFSDGLALYVRTYSRLRADASDVMSIEEIIGGLVSVIATAIEQVESREYRWRLVAATHKAFDERMLSTGAPASETVN